MFNRILQVAVTLAMTLAVGASLARAQPAHLTHGLTLVDQIVVAQQGGIYTDPDGTFLNRYGGSWNSPTDPSFIRFLDAANSIRPANNTTCAPLVTHLLKHTYGWNWSLFQIPDPLNQNLPVSTASPKAYRYVSAIKNLAGFTQQLTTLSAVQPGDIAAYWDIGTDDGHAMVVVSVNLSSAKPYPSDVTGAIPALTGTTYYEMTVLDSSSTGHTNDTRHITYNGVTGLTGGLGTGVIGVLVDAGGAIVAHTWSLPTSSYLTKKNGVWVVNPSWLSGLNSRLKYQTSRELVFGRLPALSLSNAP
jgi:hypothetical protein